MPGHRKMYTGNYRGAERLGAEVHEEIKSTGFLKYSEDNIGTGIWVTSRYTQGDTDGH